MTRREHERYENRRMIEKQQRIALITMNMKEQGATVEQLAEVSNIFTTLIFVPGLYFQITCYAVQVRALGFVLIQR